MTATLRVIRFERQLAEAVSMSNCATPTAAHFYCDNVDQQRRVNLGVDDRLERLNSSRFSAMSFDDEQRTRQSVSRASDMEQQVISTGRSTLSDDALLVDFGLIWIVFLTLDALLVTRRIGNILFAHKIGVFTAYGE